MIATLLICALLATIITNAMFGRDEAPTKSIAERHPKIAYAFVILIIVVIGIGIRVNQ